MLRSPRTMPPPSLTSFQMFSRTTEPEPARTVHREEGACRSTPGVRLVLACGMIKVLGHLALTYP